MMDIKPLAVRDHGRLIFISLLLLILFRCIPYLNIPPIWDAGDVFAAPIFLYEGGSYAELLKQPAWLPRGRAQYT